MVKNCDATFRPVSFQRGKVHVCGGHLGKYMAMTTKQEKDLDGKNYEFVKITSSEPWLVQAVSGCHRLHHSSLGRTTLVGDLLKQVVRICNGEDDPDVQLHGCGSACADVDPMLELSGNAGPGARTAVSIAVNGSRARYYGNRARGQIVTVKMPAVCPEEDRRSTAKRDVKLHIEDRRQIWLSIDDIEWFVRYMFIQNQLRGVANVDDDDEGPDARMTVGDTPARVSAPSGAEDAD